MRLLLLISLNDLRQSFSDKTLLMLMFAAPLAIATIISVTFGSMADETSPIEDLPVAVINADRGSPIADFGDQFVEVLESSSLFPGLRAYSAPDEETARSWLGEGRVSAIVVLPEDLSRRLTGPASRGAAETRVITRPDREISGDIAVTLSRAILGGFAGALGLSQAAVSGVSAAEGVAPQSVIARDEFAELTGSLREPTSSSRITIEQEALRSGGIGFNTLVAFGATQAIFFALFTANGNATSILEEQRDGTLIRLFASPTQKGAVLAGKLVSTVVMVFVQLAMLFVAFTVIGSLIQGDMIFIWGRRVGLILLVLVSTAAAAAGIGALVAALARSPEESSVIGTTITMFMAIVGGAFGFRLGGTVRFASVVYWGADAFEELAGGGTSIWTNVVVLGLFAALTSLTGFVVFVRRFSR